MTKAIRCVVLGVDNKKKNLLIHLKEGQNHFTLTKILQENGWGDFKVVKWKMYEFTDVNND